MSCRTCSRAGATAGSVAGDRGPYDMDSTLKVCPKCGEAKPATTEFFARHRRGANGLDSTCKRCHSANAKRYRAEHPEWARATEQRRREREKAQGIDRAAEWRARNPALWRAVQKSWEARNPEKVHAKWSRKQARRRGAPGSHTAADLIRQHQAQQGLCWWCAQPVGEKYHVDHLIPIAKGGTNNANNLVIACPSCNERKHAKMPVEFAGRLF